jgi:hypothetical protein
VLVLQGMRHLRLQQWRGRPVGQFMLGAILALDIAWVVGNFMLTWDNPKCASMLRRAQITAQLKQDAERHLVIVRYGPWLSAYARTEWVYNEADIDDAKVVWAREMDAAQNRKLMEYFAGRRVWLLEVDQDNTPPTLTPILSHWHTVHLK